MELLHWVGGHGFDLLEAAGIIASLTFTAFALRMDAKTRRVTNLLALTAQHRDIWSHLYVRPRRPASWSLRPTWPSGPSPWPRRCS
jgi:hypothetical protein